MMTGEQYRESRAWLIRLGYEFATSAKNLRELAMSDAGDQEYHVRHGETFAILDRAADIIAEIVEQSPGDRENIRDAMKTYVESILANVTLK